jgi:hypothetical protein
VKAGHAGRLTVGLRQDEERVAEAVAVEAALHDEPVLPGGRAGQLADAAGETVKDIGGAGAALHGIEPPVARFVMRA